MGTMFIILGLVSIISGLVVAGDEHLFIMYTNLSATPCLILCGVVLVVLGIIVAVKNSLINSDQEVQRALARVQVNKRKETALKGQLMELLEKYFSHESKLVEAIKDRKTDNLKVLLEKYPDLKASTNVDDMLGRIITLRVDITNSEFQYNTAVQKYNTLASQIPACWLRPKVLPALYTFIDNDDKENEET
ncbi:LemA family protein [Patescibacteria group bacterium]